LAMILTSSCGIVPI